MLDEISEAGVRVIMGFGYNQGGTFDIRSGTFIEYVKKFKDHPAILVWELGNEYNFHPEWFGGDIQTWYDALSAAVDAIHAEDPNHPVATAHGEVPAVELLAALPNMDLWGLNVYRWDVSSSAALDFAERSDKPMFLSEIGADSYMSTSVLGYARPQRTGTSRCHKRCLAPLFSDSVRCAGAAVFSFTDGWWKAGRADVQDAGGVAPGEQRCAVR